MIQTQSINSRIKTNQFFQIRIDDMSKIIAFSIVYRIEKLYFIAINIYKKIRKRQIIIPIFQLAKFFHLITKKFVKFLNSLIICGKVDVFFGNNSNPLDKKINTPDQNNLIS